MESQLIEQFTSGRLGTPELIAANEDQSAKTPARYLQQVITATNNSGNEVMTTLPTGIVTPEITAKIAEAITGTPVDERDIAKFGITRFIVMTRPFASESEMSAGHSRRGRRLSYNQQATGMLVPEIQANNSAFPKLNIPQPALSAEGVSQHYKGRRDSTYTQARIELGDFVDEWNDHTQPDDK